MSTQENIKTEEWRPVVGYEGLYEVSNYGIIYSIPRNSSKGGYRYGNDNNEGYLKINLSKNGKYSTKRINRIVYEAFIGLIPEGYDIHHKDHNKHNNYIENLELIEKRRHSKMHYNEDKESFHKASVKKLSKTVKQYTSDGQFIAEYKSINEASRKSGVKPYNIGRCCNKQQKTAGKYYWEFAA